MISMSTLPRVFKCTGSEGLPACGTSSKAATGGTFKHAVGRTMVLGLVPPKTNDPELQAEADAIDWAQIRSLWPDDVQLFAEASLVYNAKSGKVRYLGDNLNRGYGKLAPADIPGTADLIVYVPDQDLAVVLDFKFGSGRYAGSAADSWQLRGLAVAAQRWLGVSTVRCVFACHDGNGWKMDTVTYDEIDLAGFAVELHDLVKRVKAVVSGAKKGRLPVVQSGDHCQFCPAVPSCPAKTSLVRWLKDEAPVIEKQITALAPTDAAALWGKAKEAQGVLDAIFAGLESYAMRTPLDLGDGRMVGPAVSKREYATDKALDLLKEQVGDYAVQAATTSKSAMEKAIKAFALGTGQQPVPTAKAVMDALRKAGAFEVRESIGVKETTASFDGR